MGRQAMKNRLAPRQFDKRYADNWTKLAARARQATNGICCLCRSRKAVEVHHVRYARNGRAIAGKEQPGVDIFPLCGDCHKIAHQPKNWIKDKNNPVLGNRNHPEFVKRLQSGFKTAKKTPKLKSKTKLGIVDFAFLFLAIVLIICLIKILNGS